MSADRDEPHRHRLSHRFLMILASLAVTGSIFFASRRGGDEAFTGMAPMTSRTVQGGARTAIAPPRPANDRVRGAAFAALNIAGCLALIATSAMRRPVAPKPRGKQLKVVYAGSIMQTQQLFSSALPSTVCLAATTAEDLMSIPFAEVVSDGVCKDLWIPAEAPIMVSPVAASEDSPRSSFGHNAARKVGGCRHRASRCRRQAFCAGAQEHRRVGAQLLKASYDSVPAVVSFEPSKVKMRIQIGLRTARPRMERRQEPNVVLSNDGLSVLDGISCVAGYTMLQYSPCDDTILSAL